MNKFHPSLFFDLSRTAYADFFEGVENVWSVVARLETYVVEKISRVPADERRRGMIHETAILSGDVCVEEGAMIEPHAVIKGPCIIGKNAIVGSGAFIRGPFILGAGGVVGHATEVKNSLMLEGAKAPHFNYVGDSLLGRDVNIGAGAICANFRFDAKNIPVDDTTVGTNKFGAVLGDCVKIGCSTVLEPGTFLMPDVWIVPQQMIRRGLYKKGERHTDFEKML